MTINNKNYQLAEFLKYELLREPKCRHDRAHVVQLLLTLIKTAQTMTASELYSGDGHVVAMDICGSLAFLASEDVAGDQWLNAESEPIMMSMLQVSGRLDVDPNDPRAWRELFELSRALL